MPRSHAQTRATLRLALGFVAAAGAAAAAGEPRWVPLHLFLAGALTLAISGVSLMLTVTWSAAPAPPERWATAQRWLVAAGAAGVVAARTVDRDGDFGQVASGLAATAHLAGIVLLGALLVRTARRGVQRRFDPAVAAYLTACGFGVLGVALGGAMAVDALAATARSAHVTANVLGLVGLVVGGTLPYFASTVGRARMAPHAGHGRLTLSLCWQAAAAAAAVAGLGLDVPSLAAAGFGAYAVGVAIVLETLPRPTRRQLRWAGPRLVALWAGSAWWAVAVAATARDAGADRAVLAGRWLLVLVVAGYAQVLWGSLAYLLPVLRGGGHELLADGFTATRSWLGLVAVNAAGAGAAADQARIFGVAVAVWVLDAGWRASRVGTRPATARPAGELP